MKYNLVCRGLLGEEALSICKLIEERPPLSPPPPMLIYDRVNLSELSEDRSKRKTLSNNFNRRVLLLRLV